MHLSSFLSRRRNFGFVLIEAPLGTSHSPTLLLFYTLTVSPCSELKSSLSVFYLLAKATGPLFWDHQENLDLVCHPLCAPCNTPIWARLSYGSYQ